MPLPDPVRPQEQLASRPRADVARQLEGRERATQQVGGVRVRADVGGRQRGAHRVVNRPWCHVGPRAADGGPI